MKKIILLIMTTAALAGLSCTPGEEAISTTWLTNYVEMVITNTPDHVTNVDLMNAVKGEWLVTMETKVEYTNGYDGDSNVIYLPVVITNTFDSVTNGGYDGAFSYMFNPDFTVTKNVYNSQGTLMYVYTNTYQYSILSNEYGFRIDLYITANNLETHYIEPYGLYEDLGVDVTNITVKTNLWEWGTIEEIFSDTNISTLALTETNGWQHVIKTENTIDSFVMTYTVSGSDTNMTWTPDTNFSTVQNDKAGVLSQRLEYHDIAIELIGEEASDSSSVFFLMNQFDSFDLKKIK